MNAHLDDGGAVHQYDIYDCEPDEFGDRLDRRWWAKARTSSVCILLVFLIPAVGAVYWYWGGKL